ncbi:MAG: pitrilysin family protein [Tissierellaceae bacterium]
MKSNPERIQIAKDIYLNIINEGKFKSNLLSYYFIRPLDRREVTKNTLLSLVLRRASKNYPRTIDLERKLEELYGTNLSLGINKRGERQVIRYTMEWPKNKYLDEDYDGEIIQILKEIIFNPLVEGRGFSKSYVDQEKENLRRKIENKINDKGAYARERCFEIMCKNERFGLFPLGYVEDLEDIDEVNLFQHYQEFIRTSPIEIFYVGQVDDNIIRALKSHLEIRRDETISIPEDVLVGAGQTRNIVIDELDVNQGKLVMGYRAAIHHNDKLYNPLLLASDILGGGPNSKLFINVREKESLAYYIGSSTYKYKSLMLVESGIEFDDFDRTVEIINQQLEELKAGKFTDEDVAKSKKSLVTNTESIRDSLFLMSEFFFSQLISGDKRSLEEVLDDFQKVEREEIIEAAKRIKLDTIYFMRNKKEEVGVEK